MPARPRRWTELDSAAAEQTCSGVWPEQGFPYVLGEKKEVKK
jgi:hypothetical protein